MILNDGVRPVAATSHSRPALGVLAVILTWSVPASAQEASLEGSWSGSGYAMTNSGQRERVKCRASYRREARDVFALSAVCASPSVKLTQSGSISRVGSDRYVGDLYNPEFGISGRVRIVVSGTRQSVTISTPQGSGSLTLSKQ